MEPRWLCFVEDSKFQAAVQKGVGKGRQYLANFFKPKGPSRYPIPLIYFAIQLIDVKKLEGPQGVDKILGAV